MSAPNFLTPVVVAMVKFQGYLNLPDFIDILLSVCGAKKTNRIANYHYERILAILMDYLV